MRIATDVGGTFTDLVGYEIDETGAPVRFVTRKVDSTPPEFERAVLDVVDGIDANSVSFFAHGSTVVINALLSRRGARTALLTTRGFRDVLEIARGNRPDLFNFYFRKPPPFVPRYLRRELSERVGVDGAVIEPPAMSELHAILEDFRREGVEAIAVCFLHAYANDENERAVVREIEHLWPEVSVLASSEICREWREYERTSTTVLSAFVHPVTSRYLDSLSKGLRERGFATTPYIMQSNGGITTIAAASRNPVSMIESGPASGVFGAVELGRQIGERNLATVDIGGTTAKCALISDLEFRITTDYFIEKTPTSPGYPIKTPVVEIVEIGSGGGSIVSLDEGGKLHVGPESAGARPGPAVYGRGGQLPTTTDAHIVTGRLDAKNLLGGRIAADLESVEKAFAPLMEKLGLSREELARGVLRVANADMANALKLVSIGKGYDPREFTLVAFGGGGALHAVALGEALRFAKVVVPKDSAVFSAWGMLVTDLRRDFLQTRITELTPSSVPMLEQAFRSLEVNAKKELQWNLTDDEITVERFADLRYRGQEHTVKIRFSYEIEEALSRFHDAHERAYSFRLDRPVELVNLHVTFRGTVTKAELPKLPRGGGTLADAEKGRRPVDFDEEGWREAIVYERAKLDSGVEITGPAILEEDASTCVLPPGRSAAVDPYGNLHLTIRS